MVIDSYATLQNSIAAYLARDNLSANIPGFIQSAENKIYRKHNIRDMETAFTGTVASGSLNLPAR